MEPTGFERAHELSHRGRDELLLARPLMLGTDPLSLNLVSVLGGRRSPPGDGSPPAAASPLANCQSQKYAAHRPARASRPGRSGAGSKAATASGRASYSTASAVPT